MKPNENYYHRPQGFAYALSRMVAFFMTHLVFRRKVLRNEIKNQQGGFVVIANHECALDAVNLIGLCRRRMTFVISHSFYSTLPFRKLLDRMGVIPKQQFQTEMRDIRRMKAVVANGAPLVIYPAGLMCEDGCSTPIPDGTWSIFRLLDADVYMARTAGSYFVMPKWAKGFRPGRTYMDVYRLFTREEIHTLPAEEIRRRAQNALYFDAYADQEQYQVSYRRGANTEGLEHVLYQCPVCHSKYHVQSQGNTLHCSVCGFAEMMDSRGFLHVLSPHPEVRHVSQWARLIYQLREEELAPDSFFSLPCKVYVLDEQQHCFREAGEGIAEASEGGLSLRGSVNGAALDLRQSIAVFHSLPFSPGRYFEIQHGQEIYRCYPHEGQYVMEFVRTVKIFNRRAVEHTAKHRRARAASAAHSAK